MVVFLAIFPAALFCQTAPRQLGEALSSGDVALTANGNGSSSGSAVVGNLRNNRASEIRINVVLNGGIYLLNSGSGQNMVAVQVFLINGGYNMSGGTDRFIRLPANASTQIMFLAFCADFELDNPGPDQTFRTGVTPSGIQAISSKISRYMADNFDDELTVPAQLALWRFQGQSRAAIFEKFDFDDSDWETASRIINY
jgi:hypothetical protein